MSISQSFFSKLTAKPKEQPSKPQRKARQYVVFDDMAICTEAYGGRDSLLRTERLDSHAQRHVNPKSSFYLCKIMEGRRAFELLPMCLIRRVAYRKETKLDQSGRVIYNDPECKNYDQIATEFHCYQILQRCHRAIQMIGINHENTHHPEDKKLYYQVMKLPDRRAQGIRNIMFVLEEMNGGSLKEQIDRIAAKKQDPFTEHEVIEYTCQIAQGLQELKLRGIIHRDLRPQNILFHNKQIKISDFDSAFIRGYSDYRNIRTGLNMKDTTPLEIMQLIAESEDKLKEYTSEQLWEMQQHADIYFMGVNIYTMVFSTPFESFNGGKILNNLINIKKRNGYSPKLLDIMARCLEKDVHKRISLEEAVRRLSQIEREVFMNHTTYTRIYLSSDPLSLYDFSSNQMEQKLQFQQADFVKFSLKIDPIKMDDVLQNTIRDVTLQRRTKMYEEIMKEILHEKDGESIWYGSPSLNLLHSERRKLRAAVEQALERLQIKTFYFQLLYRILCEVNLDRLVVQAESYYADNVQSHLDLLSAEVVVVLTFLYDMIIRCNFTVDPYYAREEIGYETQRIYDSTRVLAARHSFFECRKRGLGNSFNIKELTVKLEEFKAQHDNKEEVEQVEQGVNFVIKNLRKVEALEKLIRDFQETEYEQADKRKIFWYEYTTLTKFLDRIERVLKSQMVQTSINLIISYQKLKNSKRGTDPSLKNAIFMLMIMEAQNTNHLYKNDLVIIKEELTRRINFRVGWKDEELEAFFSNYTQSHQEEVMQGLHELESQAVLGGSPSMLNIQEPEEEEQQYEVKVADDHFEAPPNQDFKIIVEEVPDLPRSQQRNRKHESSSKSKESKMEVKASIEERREKENEGNVSFRVSDHADVSQFIEQEEDNTPLPEIKVIDPSAVKPSGMERSQTFEFQLQDNSSFIRSSIPVEPFENIDQ